MPDLSPQWIAVLDYARAFAADFQRYEGVERVELSERERGIVEGAVMDLLAEAEFLDAVKALP